MSRASRVRGGGESAIGAGQRDPSRAQLAFAGVVPDGLDGVAVEVVHERGVVTWRVIAITRLAVVLRAGSERRFVEGFDLATILRYEREVGGNDGVFLGNPEVGVLAVVEARGLAVLHVVLVAQRLEHAGVE